MEERRVEERRKSKLRVIATQSQLIAYILIVAVAIAGFYFFQKNANDQNRKDRRSREILCAAIQNQSGGSEIVVDKLVALVVDNAPPPSAPKELQDRYKQSVVIMQEFSRDVKANLPVLDCESIVVGNVGNTIPSPLPSPRSSR